MIKQTWVVSDDEKNRILNLHESATKKQYLGEQTKVITSTGTTTENKSYPKTPLGNKFEYGKYESDNVKNTILSLKQSIEDFIKNSDSSKFVININAGESQVTNPSGFEEKGSLALARANSVKKYFEEIFPDLIKKGILVINSPKDVSSVSIGKTPYGGKGSGDFSNLEKKKKYESEQFVDFNITGEGTKTVTTINSKFLCDTKSLQNEGGFLSADANFTQIVPWKLNRGEGDIFISFDTFTMPDIIYFEYNGKVFGDTSFRGGVSDAYRIFVGTALRSKFGINSLPAQMGNNKVSSLRPNDQRLIQSLDEMKKWGLEESFKNTFGSESSLSNPSWMNFFKDFDKTGNKRKLISNLGGNFPWGILDSPIKQSVVTNIGPIKKVDGIDEIKVINVAPVGTTKWQVSLNCKPSV
jgi:hypothetical protein